MNDDIAYNIGTQANESNIPRPFYHPPRGQRDYWDYAQANLAFQPNYRPTRMQAQAAAAAQGQFLGPIAWARQDRALDPYGHHDYVFGPRVPTPVGADANLRDLELRERTPADDYQLAIQGRYVRSRRNFPDRSQLYGDQEYQGIQGMRPIDPFLAQRGGLVNFVPASLDPAEIAQAYADATDQYPPTP